MPFEPWMIFQMILRRCFTHHLRSSLHQYRFQSIRRVNPLGIQMLSSTLHKQLFSVVEEPTYSKETVDKSMKHLQKFDLGSTESEILEDIEFKLPRLESEKLNEHFEIIARKQSQPYVDLLQEFLQTDFPPQPTKWICTKGWTKYFPREMLFNDEMFIV